MANVVRPPTVSPVYNPRIKPVAEHGPIQNILLLNLQGKDQFFAAPGQAPSYDYPVPPSRPSSIDRLTWIAPLTINLLTPFALYNYPSPAPLPKSTALLTWTNSLNVNLPLPSAPPFAQYDYPVPKTLSKSMDLLTWIDLPQITARPVPTAYYDYPAPRPLKTSLDLLTWIKTPQLTPPPSVNPFSNNNYPVPRSMEWKFSGAESQPTNPNLYPSGPWILREIYQTITRPKEFSRTGVDEGHPVNPNLFPPGAPPLNPNTIREWLAANLFRPVPKPAPDLIENTLISTLTQPIIIRPQRNYDWSVPRSTARPIALYTWTDSRKLFEFGARPFKNYDFPAPKRLIHPSHLSTWVDTRKFYESGILPFGNYDFPAPRRLIHPPHLATWIDSRKFYEQSGLPFVQSDWPVPRGLPISIDMKTWIDSRKFYEQGTKPFAQYDWSRSRVYTIPVSLLTWLDELKISYTIISIPVGEAAIGLVNVPHVQIVAESLPSPLPLISVQSPGKHKKKHFYFGRDLSLGAEFKEQSVQPAPEPPKKKKKFTFGRKPKKKS